MFQDRIELIGNTDVYFDQCQRLLECSDMLVLAECGGHRVAVWGHALAADDLTAGGLHIHGEIASVEFDGGI